jgi:hypothetical protein
MLTAIRFTVSAPRTDQARIRAEYCIPTRRWAMPPIAAPLSYVTIAAGYRRAVSCVLRCRQKRLLTSTRARPAQTSGQRIHVFGGSLCASSGHSSSTTVRGIMTCPYRGRAADRLGAPFFFFILAVSSWRTRPSRPRASQQFLARASRSCAAGRHYRFA